MSVSEPFVVTLAPCSGMLVANVRGVLDGTGAVELQRRLDDRTLAGCPHLVLDLAGVRYLASAGVGAIMSLHRRCRDLGGSVMLAAPSDAVREILVTLNLETLIPVLPSVERALAGR